MECIPNILKTINNDYSELLLFIVALVTLYLVYKEFIGKRRPYIFPELTFEEKGDDWCFSFILKNSGSYPAQVKVNEALLKIGDEPYPTVFSTEMLVPTGEVKKILPIGHIKKIGRDRIKNSEYSVNRVEINFEISSKSIGDKDYKYKTIVSYSVDVKGDLPIVQLTSENFS